MSYTSWKDLLQEDEKNQDASASGDASAGGSSGGLGGGLGEMLSGAFDQQIEGLSGAMSEAVDAEVAAADAEGREVDQEAMKAAAQKAALQQIPDLSGLLAEREQLERQLREMIGKPEPEPGDPRDARRFPVFEHTPETRMLERRLEELDVQRHLAQQKRMAIDKLDQRQTQSREDRRRSRLADRAAKQREIQQQRQREADRKRAAYADAQVQSRWDRARDIAALTQDLRRRLERGQEDRVDTERRRNAVEQKRGAENRDRNREDLLGRLLGSGNGEGEGEGEIARRRKSYEERAQTMRRRALDAARTMRDAQALWERRQELLKKQRLEDRLSVDKLFEGRTRETLDRAMSQGKDLVVDILDRKKRDKQAEEKRDAERDEKRGRKRDDEESDETRGRKRDDDEPREQERERDDDRETTEESREQKRERARERRAERRRESERDRKRDERRLER